MAGLPQAKCRRHPFKHLARVVQTMGSDIRQINQHPLDNSIGFASVYPLDNELSGG